MQKLIVISIALFAFPLVAGANAGCMKDGKALATHGKNADEQKKDCEKQHGKWGPEETKAAEHPAAAAPAQHEQSSGGGGGW